MANCVLLSHGGSMPESPEAGAKFMQAWMDWYEQLGDKLVDRGNPAMIEKQIAPDGSVSDDSGSINGYLIISAETLDEAVAIARGCSVLQGGLDPPGRRDPRHDVGRSAGRQRGGL